MPLLVFYSLAMHLMHSTLVVQTDHVTFQPLAPFLICDDTTVSLMSAAIKP